MLLFLPMVAWLNLLCEKSRYSKEASPIETKRANEAIAGLYLIGVGVWLVLGLICLYR